MLVQKILQRLFILKHLVAAYRRVIFACQVIMQNQLGTHKNTSNPRNDNNISSTTLYLSEVPCSVCLAVKQGPY